LTIVPIAAFLAGSLLSLLLPTLLLIALVVWYYRFLRRAPDPADGSDPGSPGAAPAPPPSAPPAANAPPGER
jgi:hypothetical protein